MADTTDNFRAVSISRWFAPSGGHPQTTTTKDNTMAKYRKKPVVIEARQYTRNALEAERVAEWCQGTQDDDGLVIKTLVGDMRADYGDWIIQGVKGEFYPCKPDFFAATYEPA